MDETTKERFKWKFYSLTVLLNIIILLFALTIMCYFFAPVTFRIPLMSILLVIAIGLIIYSRRKYRETRSWLNEHT